MTDRAFISNAADPKQVKKAKQRDRHAAYRNQADLEWVLSTVQGRRFLWEELSECGVFTTSFVPGQADYTAFNEGQRQRGLKLLLRIQGVNPTLYHTMATEASALAEMGKPDLPAEASHTDTDEGDEHA